jgi:hypothetical protein
VNRAAAKRKARLRSLANERKLKRRLRAESNLPTWKVKKLPSGQFGIQCPRFGCGGKAVVNGRRWLDSKPNSETRTCTYCYAAAWIPEELL